MPSIQFPVTDSFANRLHLRKLQSEWTNTPAAAAAQAINSTLHDHGSRGWCSLRLAGDPLHLPLLQAVLPTSPPLLAFRSADAWAECLLRRECDAVLLPQAGMAADPQTAQPPKLSRALRSGVELIALGQRPLLLLHHASGSSLAAASGAAWPPRGYLLPPAAHSPLLLQALATGNRLSLKHCAAAEPQVWLQQLADHCLLLPAHLTLLTTSPWCEAALVPLQPLQPLRESLWLLLRSGDSAHPKFNALLQWWGGTRLETRQPGHGRPTGRAQGSWWRWWRRAGPPR